MENIKRAPRRRPWYHNAEDVFPGLRDTTTSTCDPHGRGNAPTRLEVSESKAVVEESLETTQSGSDVEAQENDCADPHRLTIVRSDSYKRYHRKTTTTKSQLRALLGSYMSLLLPAVPVGITLNYAHVGSLPVFIVNFLAVVANNALLMCATQELGKYLGEQSESLLSMTFGSRQTAILQASLLGGILQNLLVMTGLAFLIGGIGRQEQYFNTTAAQTISMFLLLAVLSLLVPTMSRLLGHATAEGVLAQSRGTAVIIVVSYVLFLVFSLWTNRDALIEPSQRVPRNRRKIQAGDALRGLATMGAGSAATAGGQVNQEQLVQRPEDDDEKETPSLTKAFALVAMIVFTALLALNTEYATNSLQGLMTERKLSKTFMGTVIIPILSNDFVALQAASKDRMDHALRLTLERAVQIALMLVPLVVLIAWMMGVDDLSLEFNDFTVGCLFASIVIVCYVVQQGKSNW